MADPDVRWRQRFDNFQRALQVLQRGVELARQRPLSELEQAQAIAADVVDRYAPLLSALQDRFAALSRQSS